MKNKTEKDNSEKDEDQFMAALKRIERKIDLLLEIQQATRQRILNRA